MPPKTDPFLPLQLQEKYSRRVQIPLQNPIKKHPVSASKSCSPLESSLHFSAIGIYLLDIRLPQHAVSLFSTVGATTTPLAMIVIGSTLAGVKFSTVFTDKELYLFSFLKLLVLPLITFFVLRFFIKDRTLLEISTILSGCPIAGNVSMLCMEYNRDVTLVSKGICISTLLSMISIPVVAALVAVL